VAVARGGADTSRVKCHLINKFLLLLYKTISAYYIQIKNVNEKLLTDIYIVSL
jgi:hypothetical protein